MTVGIKATLSVSSRIRHSSRGLIEDLANVSRMQRKGQLQSESKSSYGLKPRLP